MSLTPSAELTRQLIADANGQVVDGDVTMEFPALQALLGNMAEFAVRTCVNAEKERESKMKIDVETVGSPPDDMLREWIEKAGGQMDGDIAIMKLDEFKKVVMTLTKIIGRGVTKAVLDGQAQEDDRAEKSPSDFNAAMVIHIANMIETLQEMRNDFKGGENDWSTLLKEINGAIVHLRAATILACGV